MKKNYPNYITKYSLRILENRLSILENEELPKIINEKAQAYKDGGPHENAGWEYAVHQAGLITGEIEEIKQRLKNPIIIDDLMINSSEVGIGTIVEIIDVDNKEKFKFVIVGMNEKHEAQEEIEYISFLSPLAKAMLGKTKQEFFCLKLQNGISESYQILSIENYFMTK